MSEAPVLNDPGPMPQLAWLPIDRLVVDPSYQRTINTTSGRRLIARIAAEFRWSAFQAVLASPNGAGGWVLIDGQHRVAAARRRGIDMVPAVIIEAASAKDCAAAFIRANRDRSPVNPYAMHHARLSAGEAEALAIEEIAAAAMIEIPKSAPSRSNLKPGQCLALGSFTTLPRRYGIEIARAAIVAVADAYREEVGGLRTLFFTAAAVWLSKPAPNTASAADLTAAFRLSSARALDDDIARRRIKVGGSWSSAAEAVIGLRLARIAGHPAAPSAVAAPAAPRPQAPSPPARPAAATVATAPATGSAEAKWAERIRASGRNYAA